MKENNGDIKENIGTMKEIPRNYKGNSWNIKGYKFGSGYSTITFP